MSPPCEVMLKEESGSTGKIILIQVRKKFEVSHIAVSMIAPDGKILDSREIYHRNTLGFHVYTLTDAATAKPGVICRICVQDFPGNVTEKDYHFFG